MEITRADVHAFAPEPQPELGAQRDGAVAPLVARLRSDALILSGHEIEDWAIGAGGDCANDPVAYILTLQELLRMGEKLTGDSAQIRVDHAARLAQCVETLLKDNKKITFLAISPSIL